MPEIDGTMHARMIVMLAAVLLVAVGCESRKQNPDPTKGRVTGVVLCADTGKPARFALVTLIQMPNRDTNLEPSSPFASAGSTFTDLDGRFTLEAIPPGQYFAMATLDGYQDPERGLDPARLQSRANDAERAADTIAQWKDYLVPLKVSVHRTTDISISIERAAEIGGTVLYDDGSPAIGAHFLLMRKTENGTWAKVGFSMFGGWALSTVSDSHGRFNVASLPAGEYQVCALLPTASEENTLSACLGNVLRRKDSSSIKVGTGEQASSVEIIVPLAGLHSVGGTVTALADGHAIPHGTAQLLYADDHESLRTTALDEDGQFSFEFVPEGKYILRISDASDAKDDGSSDSAQTKARSAQVPRYVEQEIQIEVAGNMNDADVVLSSAAQDKP